jgi:type IV secretion system protein VirB11
MSDIVSRQLNWLLRPIQPFLDDSTVTDIHINGPDRDGATTTLFVKQGAKRSQHTVPLTLNQLENIADNAAALMRQDIAEDAPFCATRLPGGQRVQIVRPPAVPEGRYAMAIRRPSAKAATIQQLIDNGVFSEVRSAERVRAQPRPIVRELLALKAAQRWPELIALAIRNGFNVVWAGMVGTGKTYDLRAFLEAIPIDWRIVTVEDMEEIINMAHPNVVNLLYPKGKDQGVSKHTAEDCIEAALRLDMDMLVNQELRDSAAWAYLRALNSGHPGMTSCHAPSAEGAFKAIGLMVRQHESGKTLSNDDLQATLHELIHIVAYCETIDGRRRVTQVYFEPEIQKGIPSDAASLLAA